MKRLPPMTAPIALLVTASVVAAACGGSTSSNPTAKSAESSTTSSEVSTATSPATEVDLKTQLSAAAENLIGDAEGGGSFLIHRDGETTAVTLGPRNATGDPITVDTEFHVASISKVFIATMVMQLADEATLDLDGPIKDYLPNLGIDGDPTVRQVLAHKSGFAEYTTEKFLVMIEEDPTKTYSPNDLLATVEDKQADEPGGEFEYVNTNYIVLGQLIEALTGDTIDEALQARIAEPLKLTHTRFTVADSDYVDDMAAPWQASGATAGEPDFEYTALRSASWAAGSLVSTPGDLQRFLEALMSGELTSESAVEQMKPEPGSPYGLGVEAVDLPGLDGRTFIGHGGNIHGYVSYVMIEPETGTVLSMVVNNDEVDNDENTLDSFSKLL